MHVVIMGCGRTGSRIARRLEKLNHTVGIIDKDARSFHLLDIDFKGIKVTGIGFDSEALIEAGIQKADVFIAVGSGDNSNIVSSVIAKDTFQVPKVITRIYDPRRATIYRRFGILTVAPVKWGVNRILDLMLSEGKEVRAAFGNGEVQLIEFELPNNVAGKTAREFYVPGEIHVAALERSGEAIIPVGGTKLEQGDILHVLVYKSGMDKFNRMFFA